MNVPISLRRISYTLPSCAGMYAIALSDCSACSVLPNKPLYLGNCSTPFFCAVTVGLTAQTGSLSLGFNFFSASLNFLLFSIFALVS